MRSRNCWTGGEPLEKVQKLCDVHSSLFHGSISGEGGGQGAKLPPLPKGHPLQVLREENAALEALLAQTREALAQGGAESIDLAPLRQVALHYAKKGDLLYPHLHTRYQISGPSQVMWTVDGEIRGALMSLDRAKSREGGWLEKLEQTLTRMAEMVYKEQFILFPLCLEHFTQEEWYGIYQDAKDYAPCLGVEPPQWPEAESAGGGAAPAGRASDSGPAVEEGEALNSGDRLELAGGSLRLEELSAMLNTIPLELTFVDGENLNRYFNLGPKLFKRPSMALNRDVASCHPPKVAAMVSKIISDLRSGAKDSVDVWMDKMGRTVYVRYMAVRSPQGEYLGVLEAVQEMDFAREYFAKRGLGQSN